MKKIFVSFLIVSVFLWISTSTHAITKSENGITYSLSDDGAAVISVENEEEITIPPYVEFEGKQYPVISIERNAFKGSETRILSIPSTVTYIGSGAFENVFIETLYIESLESWCGIEFEYETYGLELSVSSCTSNPLNLLTKFYVNNELMTDLIIPEEVISLNPFVFSRLRTNKVIFPTYLKEIPVGAFSGATILDDLNFPSRLNYIRRQAFHNSSLGTVNFDPTIMEIGSMAFEGARVGDLIFNGSPWINENAFSKLSGQVNLYLNFNMNNVSNNAFTSITNCYVPSLEVWEHSFISNYEKFDGIYSLYVNNEKVTELSLNSAEAEMDFISGIKDLESLTLEEGSEFLIRITSFQNLKFLSLPASLENIDAINHCPNLSDIVVKAVTPPHNLFKNYTITMKNLFENCVVHVPLESVDGYKKNAGWGLFYNIVGEDFAGIDNPQFNDNENSIIYDLYGRTVNPECLTPGIYIKNGKKFLIK